MPYTVTRQLQWPEGTPVVEISAGGRDYTNPDALSPHYPGEFETFGGAMAVGMTLPFDSCTFQEAREWAKGRHAKLLEQQETGDE